MKEYTYDITINAANEAEAEAKLKALSTLGVKLTARELEKLAWVVKNDPVKTALAKRALGV